MSGSLHNALAKVAIAALVDEATGTQFDRTRTALAILLEEYVTEELAQWAKTFEDNFYKEIYRLRRWDVAEFKKRPGWSGSGRGTSCMSGWLRACCRTFDDVYAIPRALRNIIASTPVGKARVEQASRRESLVEALP